MYNSLRWATYSSQPISDNARRSPSIIPIIWKPPPHNWIKVNIDGAAKRALGHSGCGGIFRNCRGFSKGCFLKYLAFEAELVGFIVAIEIAKKFNWSPLWIKTDSSYVVSIFLTGSLKVPREVRSRWSKALSDAKTLHVHVSQIYREENCVADKLVSLSSTPSFNKWWLNQPAFLSSLMYLPMPFYRFKNL